MPRAALNITPLADAVDRLARKTPVGSLLGSRQWADVPLALRERAQFSARIESVRVMATIQDKLLKRAAMLREQVARGEAGVDAGSFMADLKRVMRQEGFDMGGERLRDASSAARLKLIWDHQLESAASYARWKAAQDPDALDNFPAQEFLRVEQRQAPRDWAPRWDMAFAPFEGATRAASGRMVALASHPGWMRLSRFGTPFPPFDYGSGMGVESVSRKEALALGLLGPDDQVESAEAGFNDALEASVRGVPGEIRSALQDIFGDQIQFQGDRVIWQGNLIGDLVDRVKPWLDRTFDNQVFKGQSISFGQAQPQTVKIAEKSGFDLTGGRMVLTPDVVYHILREHSGDREKRRDQQPITKLDFELLPWTWREPDDSETEKGSLVLTKKLLGRQMMVVWEQRGQNVYHPISVRIKKLRAAD